ncbi:hypothetical protein ACFVR2_17845 [Gottfriedia sp. NPDC057991]|uniref:hypothetical protein n=1 Tax=Gottfriedia sp. NPDC057991 TaxID=3346298 RepID=UPI0036DEE0BD
MGEICGSANKNTETAIKTMRTVNRITKHGVLEKYNQIIKEITLYETLKQTELNIIQ